MVEYKDRLAKAMADKNVDVSALAKEIGVTYQAVKKVLDGRSGALSAPNHARAAKFLDVSSDWLALGEGPQARGGDSPWPFISIDAALFSRMPERVQGMAEQAALTVIKEWEQNKSLGVA